MKNSTVTPICFHKQAPTLLSILVVGLLALPAKLQAVEDPVGCSFPTGLGNSSQSGINFDNLYAHVGDSVPVFTRLGMSAGACRAINVTGSVWTAASSVTSVTNFLIDVSLEPGVPINCPGADVNCEPGPYNVLLTSGMVGAPVIYPLGIAAGVPKAVRAVVVGEGTVLTQTEEQLGGANTATILIVTPCIQVVKQCAYPANSPTCFPAGADIDFTGYVTNCGDIRLTNVTVVDNRVLEGLGLTDLNGFPLLQPLTLDPGQAIAFKGRYTPTLAETCAGSAVNTIAVRGTDVTTIGGPRASVTNTATATCAICVNPCLAVTKECTPAILGGPQTVSGVVNNCGNLALTNISVVDNVFGSITNIPFLAAGASANYRGTFTATLCGTTPNIVTAAGFMECGAGILARATNSCFVDCPPCIKVDKTVACAIGPNCGPFGELATGMKGNNQNPTFCYSITVSNCGSISLTNARVLDDKLGDLTASFFASPGTLFPVGASITRIVRASWATDTTNTVIALGQSTLDGRSVSDTNDAVARVVQATVTCSMQVSSPDDLDGNPNDRHVSLIPLGSHNVTFTVTACSGASPLANVTITSPALAALGCTLPPPFSLLANTCSNFTCTVPVNCANIPAGSLTNAAVITAIVDTSSGVCGLDANGNPITVASTQGGPPCATVIECIPTACLGDFLWDDYNRNGAQDAGEPGIPNVTLLLQSCGATNVLQTTVTGTIGDYLFCDLLPGQYQVQVLVPGGYTVTLQNSTNDCRDSDANARGLTDCVTLSSGETNLCTDIGLHRPGALGDYVWEDVNHNGLQEGGEPGIGNVPVRLYDCANNLLASTTTAGNGLYLFTNLPPGGYVVGFAATAGYQYTLPNAGNDALDSDANAVTGMTGCYTLGSGETNLTVDAGFYQPCVGQIGDFVWHDVNGDGCQDPSESGIPGVQVDLYSGCATNTTFLRSTNTDSTGRYLFNGLCVGQYTVSFSTPFGYARTTAKANCSGGGQPAAETDSDCDCEAEAACGVCVTLTEAKPVDLSIDCGYVAPCVSLFDEYLIVGMRPRSNGEAVTIGSSQEIGADRQTLSGDNPSDPYVSPVTPNISPAYPAPYSPDLRDVFFKDPSGPTNPRKNRWLWHAATQMHYLPGAAKLFRGVDWSGEVAVTSPSGSFSLQDINVFAAVGFRSRSTTAPVNVSNSRFFAQAALTGVLMDPIEGGGASQPARGWIGGYDHEPLLSELRALRAFIRGLPKDADFHSGNHANPRDLVNRNTIDAGGALTGPNTKLVYDLNALDVNGDGYAVIDIPSDGTDFEVNNSDLILTDSNLTNGTPFAIFRIRGKANMNMSQSSIMAGEGVGTAFSGLAAAFVKVHPEEEFTSLSGSSDSVFTANNLVINRIGFWDLNTIGDAPTDSEYPGFVNRSQQNNYTILSVNNGQGCGQFISGQVYFQNVRFVRCSECIPEAPAPNPILALAERNGNLVFSWSMIAQGFELECAEDLNGAWIPLPEPVELVGDNCVVNLVQPTVRQMFFRLYKR